MQNDDSIIRNQRESSPLSTTSSLVGNLQAGSRERWETFVLLYSPLLRFWIRREKVALAAEDDVLQETLRSVFSGIGQFTKDSQCGTFRGWLRTIVKRRAVDHFRTQPAESIVSQSSLEAIPVPAQKDPADIQSEEQALTDLKARALELVRQSTSEKTWQMFWLNLVEGVPTSELAKKFNVTPAAVRMAKARVLSRLRELMGDDAHEIS